MKIFIRNSIILAVWLVLFIGCASAPEGPAYTLSFDKPLYDKDNTVSLSTWMSYTAYIRSDMDAFYKATPDGQYHKKYMTEYEARLSMIEFYQKIRKDPNFKNMKGNQYIDEMIQIKDAGYFKEYVYFSFNDNTWEMPDGLDKEKYDEYMKSSLPNHKGLTLATVSRG